MKKFDHLTSLDAIDPLPSKLGEKVTCSKIEKTKYHMGHKLKPGFSIEDGKLSYAPPAPAREPKRFEEPVKIEQCLGNHPAFGGAPPRSDFDGDAFTIYEYSFFTEPQMGPLLKSHNDAAARKLNKNDISGKLASDAVRPFDPTGHTTLPSRYPSLSGFTDKSPEEPKLAWIMPDGSRVVQDDRPEGSVGMLANGAKLSPESYSLVVAKRVSEVCREIVEKHGVSWDSVAKWLNEFTHGELDNRHHRKGTIVLDSLTPIVDQMISLEKQPRESEMVTLELPKERLKNRTFPSVKIPFKAESDSDVVESSADSKKVSPFKMNTDQLVQWLVALDAAITTGQIDRAEVMPELLRVRRAQLKECLFREEFMNLSDMLTLTISRRFHTEPDGRYNSLRYSSELIVFQKAVAEIASFGPSRFVRFLRSVESEEITHPAAIAVIPVALRGMSNYQLRCALNNDLPFEIPEKYKAIMEKEQRLRLDESQAESTLSKMN